MEGAAQADSPVNVLVDFKQVVHHGLECQLMENRRNGVVATVDDYELRASFVCALINRMQQKFTTTTQIQATLRLCLLPKFKEWYYSVFKHPSPNIQTNQCFPAESHGAWLKNSQFRLPDTQMWHTWFRSVKTSTMAWCSSPEMPLGISKMREQQISCPGAGSYPIVYNLKLTTGTSSENTDK